MKPRALLATFSLCALALAAFAGVEQSVNDLIPRLAAAKVEDRYSAQMELQQIASNASRPSAETTRAELVKLLAANGPPPPSPSSVAHRRRKSSNSPPKTRQSRSPAPSPTYVPICGTPPSPSSPCASAVAPV